MKRLASVGLGLVSVLAVSAKASAYEFEVSGRNYIPSFTGDIYTDLSCTLDIEPIVSYPGPPKPNGEPAPTTGVGLTTIFDGTADCSSVLHAPSLAQPSYNRLPTADNVIVETYSNNGQYSDEVYIFWQYGRVSPVAKVCWYFAGNQELGYQASTASEEHQYGSGFCTPDM